MKRLFAAAIVLSTLGALPVAAETGLINGDLSLSQSSKGSVWLVLVLLSNYTNGDNSMIKIEMKDLDQCNEQGALYVAHQGIQPDYREGRQFICVEGK